MKRVLDFLKRLASNNNKEWFDANRAEWNEVRGFFYDFTQGLIDGIASFDPSVKGVEVKNCTYRINRDIRFSHDKTPYKTNIGAYVAPGGKKSGYAGYYFHVNTDGSGFFGTGIYMPEPKILRSVRDEIFDNGAQILKTIENSNGFVLYTDDKLKRTPRGFPTDSEFDELLKLKHMFIQKPMTRSFMLSDNLLAKTCREFKTTTPFLDIVNRAVKFGYEEGV